MQGRIGAILLVAGTCIGSGMIALPLMLAKLGIIPSVLLMIFVWALTYYTSLISLELNLQAGSGLSLGALGKRFSGPIAEAFGTINLNVLSYALLAVFISGGSSIIKTLLQYDTSVETIIFVCSLATMIILVMPIKIIDYANRILFVGMIIVVAALIGGLVSVMKGKDLPLISDTWRTISVWQAIIPVVFTSFGFQVIFHTLTNYCHQNAPLLRSVFFWGSFIPALVYILWTGSVLTVLHGNNPEFYQQMIKGKAGVGDLINELSTLATGQSVQSLVWYISLLAIATSILGVGVGLCDSIKSMLANRISHSFIRRGVASVATVVPACGAAVWVPNAFITILGFAGMILVVIAIMQPLYLLQKIKVPVLYYPVLKKKWLLAGAGIVGAVIISCEIIKFCQ
jgi:tyrosine-specific transport protein